MQTLATADVHHVGVRGGDSQIADRSAWRLIEDRTPGAAVVVCLPDAAVVDAHEEDSGLRGDADRPDCPARAERADQTVAQLLVEPGIQGPHLARWLRVR